MVSSSSAGHLATIAPACMCDSVKFDRNTRSRTCINARQCPLIRLVLPTHRSMLCVIAGRSRRKSLKHEEDKKAPAEPAKRSTGAGANPAAGAAMSHSHGRIHGARYTTSALRPLELPLESLLYLPCPLPWPVQAQIIRVLGKMYGDPGSVSCGEATFTRLYTLSW